MLRANHNNAAGKSTAAQKAAFNAQSFLDSAGVARNIRQFRKCEILYAQGDPASHIFYIQDGHVKLSIVSKTGKEAVIAILQRGDFFGEGCLAGQSVRMGSAVAMTSGAALVIEKGAMLRVLHEEHALSDLFIAFVLARNLRVEEDLVDQLFNSSEKRLARLLLLLARYGKEDHPHHRLPQISQETMAEMIGTTRSRVNFFMNKFKRLGFIEYKDGFHVNASLLTVVLHD